MRKKNQLEDPPQEVAQPETELPPGVKLKHTLRGHTGPIGRIAWSPDGRTLASPSADSTIRLWNSETGQCVRKLKGQGGGHECVAFDPAGKILAAKNSDGTVGVWDIASGILTKISETRQAARTGESWRFFKDERTPGRAPVGEPNILYDHTGRILFISGSPMTVWDVTTGTLLHTLNISAACIANDPASDCITGVNGTDDATVWSGSSGNIRTRLRDSGVFYGISFDHTGQSLVTAGHSVSVIGLSERHASGYLKIWDSTNGTLLRTLEGHTSVVDWAEFSADGLLLRSKSNDNTFRLWRCDTWATVAVVQEFKDNRRKRGKFPGKAFSLGRG